MGLGGSDLTHGAFHNGSDDPKHNNMVASHAERYHADVTRDPWDNESYSIKKGGPGDPNELPYRDALARFSDAPSGNPVAGLQQDLNKQATADKYPRQNVAAATIKELPLESPQTATKATEPQEQPTISTMEAQSPSQPPQMPADRPPAPSMQRKNQVVDASGRTVPPAGALPGAKIVDFPPQADPLPPDQQARMDEFRMIGNDEAAKQIWDNWMTWHGVQKIDGGDLGDYYLKRGVDGQAEISLVPKTKVGTAGANGVTLPTVTRGTWGGGEVGIGGLGANNPQGGMTNNSRSAIEDMQHIGAHGHSLMTTAGAQAHTFEEERKSIEDKSNEATLILNNLKMQRQFIDSDQFYSGPLDSAVLDLKKLNAVLGGDPNKALPMEAFTKFRAGGNLESLQDLRGLGQLRSAEIQFVKEASGGLNNTRAANRAINSVAQRVQQRYIEIGNKERQYVAEHGALDTGWRDQLAQYNHDNPLFTDEEMADYKKALKVGGPGEANGPTGNDLYWDKNAKKWKRR